MNPGCNLASITLRKANAHEYQFALARREELIARTKDNKELRIFSTTIPTEHRIHTLAHDPVYRLGMAWQKVAYNVPAHTSFYLGHGMKTPPRPSIVTVRSK